MNDLKDKAKEKDLSLKIGADNPLEISSANEGLFKNIDKGASIDWDNTDIDLRDHPLKISSPLSLNFSSTSIHDSYQPLLGEQRASLIKQLNL